jgi:predicted alpha/beta hydrolase family esterase
MTTRRPVLMLPGYGNSGPGHWQSLWEAEAPDYLRVHQRSWDRPEREAWVDAVETAVRAQPSPPVLVAHSLACLAVAHWAAGPHSPAAGALLVAPPDPHGPAFPPAITGFAPLPARRLGLPAVVVVASTDDPYADEGFVTVAADAWGARLVSAGAAGHVNPDSGHGPWPQGRALLADLLASLEGAPRPDVTCHPTDDS